MPASAARRRGASALERLLPGRVRRIVERARGKDLPLYAASLAFYGLVSIVPAVIMVLWILGLALGDERVHHLAAELGRSAPAGVGADRFLERVVDLGTGIGLWAAATALWPASSYGAGLTRAFDELAPGKTQTPRALRGRGLALIALLPLLVLGGLAGSYASGALLGSEGAAAVASWVLGVLLGLVGVAGAVALILRIFPPVRLGWTAVVGGTAVAAGGIAVISLLFTLYLNLAANFQQHYATSGLAGLVLLAVWLFLSNVFILCGFQAALEV